MADSGWPLVLAPGLTICRNTEISDQLLGEQKICSRSEILPDIFGLNIFFSAAN